MFKTIGFYLPFLSKDMERKGEEKERKRRWKTPPPLGGSMDKVDTIWKEG